MENVQLAQDFASLQKENEKPVSGLLPVQFVESAVCLHRSFAIEVSG